MYMATLITVAGAPRMRRRFASKIQTWNSVTSLKNAIQVTKDHVKIIKVPSPGATKRPAAPSTHGPGHAPSLQPKINSRNSEDTYVHVQDTGSYSKAWTRNTWHSGLDGSSLSWIGSRHRRAQHVDRSNSQKGLNNVHRF